LIEKISRAKEDAKMSNHKYVSFRNKLKSIDVKLPALFDI
jgi:hypothetical protein